MNLKKTRSVPIFRSKSSPNQKARLLLPALAIGNILIWGLAYFVFCHKPALLGMAALAYSLGLRHAIDADHLAAIDNATRAAFSQNKSLPSLGLFFSLGHSTVVIIACCLIVIANKTVWHLFQHYSPILSLIGSFVSISFLLFMAIVNGLNWLKQKKGIPTHHHHSSPPLTRLVTPLILLVRQSWHMYPVGFLFGLGFDTATEVGILSLSAAEAVRGIAAWQILILPLLFTIAMAFVDTADGILVLGLYKQRLTDNCQKRDYSRIISLLSASMAFVIAFIQIHEMAHEYFPQIIAMPEIFENFYSHLNIGLCFTAIMIFVWAYFILRGRPFSTQ